MRRTFAVLFAVLALAAGGVAGGERDHDRARAALQAGEVLPLTTILERVAQQHPGQVLGVELEHERGRWIYELKLLESDGVLVELEVDASDATVLEHSVEHD